MSVTARADVHTGRRIAAIIATAALTLGALAAVQAATVAPAVAEPTGEVVYDAIPDALEGNYVSIGYRATQTSEVGELVQFGGTGRTVETATVLFSSWACESGTGPTCATTPGATFPIPITINVYEPGDGTTAGALLGSVTQEASIPFRPSADPAQCGGNTTWYSAADGRCFSGLATPWTFDLGGIDVGEQAIVSIAYDGNYSIPARSLNVALTAAGDGETAQPTIGSLPTPGSLYTKSTSPIGYYCDTPLVPPASTGTFHASTGWAGCDPIGLELTASHVDPPAPPVAVTVYPGNLSATNASATRTGWNVGGPFPEFDPTTLPTGSTWVWDIENKPAGSASIGADGLTLAVTQSPAATKARFQYYLGTGGYDSIDSLGEVTLADVFDHPLSWTQTLESGDPTYGVTLQIQLEKETSEGQWSRQWVTGHWTPGSGPRDLGSGLWFASVPIGSNAANSGPGVTVDALLEALGDWEVVSFGPNLGRDLTYTYAVQDLTILGTEFHFASPTTPPAWETGANIDFSAASGYLLGQGQPATGVNGWKQTENQPGEPDWALVNTATYPDSGLGGWALRYSNAVAISGRQLQSPTLAETAGLPASGAEHNAFGAKFWIASSTGGLQPGLNVQVAVDGGAGHPYERTGGVVNFRHVAEGLEVSWLGFPLGGVNSDTSAYTTDSTVVSADEPHYIEIGVVFNPNGNDLAQVAIDGEVALTGTSWRGFYSAPNAARNNSVGSLMFRTSSTAPIVSEGAGAGYGTVSPTPEEAAALAGQGFVFTELQYGVSDVELPLLAFDSMPAPTISGAARVGETVSVATTGWSPTPEEVAVEWFAGTTSLGTGPSYTLQPSDTDTSIHAVLTATKTGYEPSVVTTPSVTARSAVFSEVPKPVLSGVAEVGRLLEVASTASRWQPVAPTTLTYDWLRDGVSLGLSPDTMSYRPTSADAGTTITVLVTGAREGYVATSKLSNAKTVTGGEFELVPKPNLSGVAEAGRLLSVTAGSWGSLPPTTLTFDWLRDGASIGLPPETTEYRLTSADAGHTITVLVTGARAGFVSASKLSNSKPITGGQFDAVPKPGLAGVSEVGRLLSVSTSLSGWGAFPPTAVSYDWRRDGVSMGLAPETTSYRLTNDDAGHVITVVVTGYRDGFDSASQVSYPKSVTGGEFTSVPRPSMSGVTDLGRTLRVDAKADQWTPIEPATLTYDWMCDGDSLGLDPSTTQLRVTAALQGCTINVLVTGSSPGFDPVTKLSYSKTIPG